jgi:urease accessory protein
MIIEKPMGAISEPEFSALAQDTVDIAWFDAGKRLGRITTHSGLELGIRLNREAEKRGLHNGDVLSVQDGTAVVVHIIPTECLVVAAPERDSLIRLCYEVGNRHASLFFDEKAEVFLLPYDEPMELLIKSLGLTPERKQAQLLAQQRVGSAHGHGSGHGHGGNHDGKHAHGHGEHGSKHGDNHGDKHAHG